MCKKAKQPSPSPRTQLTSAGPKVVHQVPINSITSAGGGGSGSEALIHFPNISSAVIPQQSLCSLPVTLLSHPYRVLTHPMCLASASYLRNEFIFSFSFVLHHRTATAAYASVVTKLAALFKHLEETSHFLSRDEAAPNSGKIYALCEILLEDLNNYCEAMIPIDDANTLNIKLFPVYPPPPALAPHHVPLATVRLAALTDSNWDLTMLRILPFLDGVRSIRAIARAADADYKLVRQAVAHLVYYGCVTLLDVFNFGASYAPSSAMAAFVGDPAMQEEARAYVLSPFAAQQQDGSSASASASASGSGSGAQQLDHLKLVELYASLRQGLSLRNWCMDHAAWIGVIDVRRFITFGVIKGFIYRVHKYAVAASRQHGEAAKNRTGAGAGAVAAAGAGADLDRFLDGTHCFDEICTELMISEKELLARLKAVGDVQIIHR